MGEDKRLQTLQEEIKLLKGEIKQSLASVRDYLLNMELPASEFATILDELEDDGAQKMTMSGTLELPRENKKDEKAEEASEPEPEAAEEDLITLEEPPEAPQADETPASEEPTPSPEQIPPAAEAKAEEESAPDKAEDSPAAEEELPLEENMMDFTDTLTEPSPTPPKVNMLANLITWVARAKREIGHERLPILLEVYGVSGHLSPELKEVILHLAEITGEAAATEREAEVWGQAILSLHGILTGGDAPLNPIIPLPTEEKDATAEEPEAEKPKKAPFKLKLVFPDGDGKEKEFCLNLTPEDEGDDSESPPKRLNDAPEKRRGR